MKIIVFGSEGKMGKETVNLLKSSKHILAAKIDRCGGDGVYRSCFDCHAEADVVIDFSTHEATRELSCYLLGLAGKSHTALVTAVTGRTYDEAELIKLCAKKLPVFESSNLSVGATIMDDIVRKISLMLPLSDIEIVETHRNGKLDLPSGTALSLAKTIDTARKAALSNRAKFKNIGMHSLRLGNTVGKHEVIFDDGFQSLTISHTVTSRKLFAIGAVTAAEFIADKAPGLYSMNDMINAQYSRKI